MVSLVSRLACGAASLQTQSGQQNPEAADSLPAFASRRQMPPASLAETVATDAAGAPYRNFSLRLMPRGGVRSSLHTNNSWMDSVSAFLFNSWLLCFAGTRARSVPRDFKTIRFCLL